MSLLVEGVQVVQHHQKMMIENALKAAPSQSELHGQGKLSENALGKLVPRKNFDWGHVFRLWCRRDCRHEQVESQRF